MSINREELKRLIDFIHEEDTDIKIKKLRHFLSFLFAVYPAK